MPEDIRHKGAGIHRRRGPRGTRRAPRFPRVAGGPTRRDRGRPVGTPAGGV